MKALGIVRNIDQLGRIVIPMEIRKAKRWGSDTPMEMFMSEEGLVIREYGVDHERSQLLSELNNVLIQTENGAAKKIIGQAIEFINKG